MKLHDKLFTEQLGVNTWRRYANTQQRAQQKQTMIVCPCYAVILECLIHTMISTFVFVSEYFAYTPQLFYQRENFSNDQPEQK